MKRKLKVTIFIVLILLISVICYSINKVKNNAFVKLIINNQEILISKDTEQQVFDLETLNTEYDTNIKVEFQNAKVKIKDNEINNEQEISLGKLNISNNDKIEIYIKLFGELGYRKIEINTLPSKFPEIEFYGSTEEKGDFYVTTYEKEDDKEHYIYKLDRKGNVIFYRQTPNVCYNFQKNICNEKSQVRYTYLETFGERSEGFTVSLSTKLVVLNEKYEKINEIYYLSKYDGITEEQKRLDNHDYIYLDDNHYIISGFVKETVYDFPLYPGEPIELWNCRIQEVLNGEIIWEFETSKQQELYSCLNIKNYRMMRAEYVLDYVHFNSIKIDSTDNNLICSFRNLDAIIKLDRKTGEIIWILGGLADQFGLSEQQKFSKQHSISFLSDNSILLYDNGCEKERSRVLIIKLDEKNKRIDKFENYDLNLYSSRMGAVQVVNEEKCIYLVTYGVGDLKYAFEEINLKTSTPNVSVKLKPTNNLYCVNKY